MQLFLVMLWLLAASTTAQQDLLGFSNEFSNYQLASNSTGPEIWIANNEQVSVKRAANDVAVDFGRVTGKNGTYIVRNSTAPTSGPVIIAGTVGQSTLIDTLISNNKVNVESIQGKWEAYTSTFVENPFDGVPWALVVAGSNQRGTIYGLYDISETIGVSPWYWWADVAPKIKTGVWVRDTAKVQGPPSVKYRGIFINDEAPGLSTWGRSNFGSPPFNSDFYGHVSELLLRSKANYLWPAMWGSGFYVDDAKNGPLADEYGIFMGTSHHEPMARSELEQKSEITGDWDWLSNKGELTEFFRGGAERAAEWDTIYTMGMRGSGDTSSPTLTAESLEEVIRVQQSILSDVYNTADLSAIPQTWVLYKEVGKYYQAGMKVPDDILLLWTDDNAGNLLRTPYSNETDHPAGHGIYYHFDYVGSPRNYKWINTIQLIKTWEQMQLAYEKGARSAWIVNVGDIKPLEIPTAHFLDMAYDMSRHAAPDSVTEWIKRWATSEFGSRVADRTAEILNTYGKLIIRRKYELLSNSPFVYSPEFFDEAESVLEEWIDLLALAQSTYDALSQENRTPFFEMVLHPVLAGKTVVELYIKAALNSWRYKQRRTSTDNLANDVQRLFAEDKEIENRYHSLKGGKWNQILVQPHIGYTSWNDPTANTMPSILYHNVSNVPKSGIMGVSVQGSDKTSPGDPAPTLLSVDPYMPESEKRYLDIYTRNNGTFSFSIKSNVSYVTVANASGSLTAPDGPTDLRNYISVDWSQAPSGLTYAGLTIVPTDAPGSFTFVATLPVNKTAVPNGFTGYVESGGLVSIEAEHYAEAEQKNSLSYVTLPHYGRTLSAIKLWPVTADSQTASSAPRLKYSFHTFTSREKARVVVLLGGTINHDPSRPLKYAFSIDGGEAVEVQPVPDTPMGEVPSGWTAATVGGGWTSFTTADLAAGSHELSLWLLEPGVVVQKVVLDVGGWKNSGLGPPESYKV